MAQISSTFEVTLILNRAEAEILSSALALVVPPGGPRSHTAETWVNGENISADERRLAETLNDHLNDELPS